MIKSLHIENYVLIDSLDIDFPEGLVIITGQTGAGKSILLGAISLLLGARADASCISAGADNCVVEAVFDPGDVIVRRVVSKSGRSRCFIDDCPAQAAELAELGARMLDIHSQHKSLMLTDNRFQLLMLDRFAGNEELLTKCQTCFKELSAMKAELVRLLEESARAGAGLEYATAQFNQLNAAKLREGELEELESEQKQLSHAESIREDFFRLGAAFEPEGGRFSVDGALKEGSRVLGRISAFMPQAGELESRLDSARIELQDILSEAESLGASVSVSGQRLEQVESRLSELYALLTKHSCRTIAELIALRDRYEAEISGSSDIGERISELEKCISVKESEYSGIAAALRSSRTRKAEEFSDRIREYLRFLELESAYFGIEFSPAEASATGEDSVRFLFSAGGTVPSDLAKCASGGELSRIMLSLKALMAKYTGMPTMIFDEIDTGVSGSVADKMGRIICEMGLTMQVVAITHLPQVAAKGSAHFVVSKSISGGVAKSSLTRLDNQGRINEIARLLSGSTITAEAVANAKSLLNSN